MWRNMHNNMKPKSIWFPVTLTYTDLNIEVIQVKCYIYWQQRVDYGEQDDTTCLVLQFTWYVAGPSEICPPRILMERSRTASLGAVLQRASSVCFAFPMMPIPLCLVCVITFEMILKSFYFTAFFFLIKLWLVKLGVLCHIRYADIDPICDLDIVCFLKLNFI